MSEIRAGSQQDAGVRDEIRDEARESFATLPILYEKGRS